jgi:hypothetical protein
MALTLTTDERTELERRVRSLKIRAEDARRARVPLLQQGSETDPLGVPQPSASEFGSTSVSTVH